MPTMKNILSLLLINLLFCSSQSFAQIGPITDICLVTVDTSLTNNVVVWERADQTSAVAIDSMYIYRVTLAGTDSLIARVDYDSLSEYIDSNANPNLRAYTYRIAGKDINGLVGPLSTPHRTIHFILMENVQGQLWLKWTPYVGKSINYYQCWDMTVDPSNPDLVNATSNNTDTSWNYGGAIPGTYDMKVDVNWVGGCTSTKANHNTTRSNKASGIFTGTGSSAGISEEPLQEIFAMPNPTSDIVNIGFSSTSWSPIHLKVIDINGRVVKSFPPVKVLGQYTQSVDMSDLSPGLYNVILDNGTIKTLRIMKN